MPGDITHSAIELGASGSNFDMATEDCVATDNVIIGFASGVGTPLFESDGPRPRINTFFAVSPVTVNPAMETRSPVTFRRSCGTFALGF